MKKTCLIGSLLLLYFSACKDTTTSIPQDYESGVFAVNEGIFGQSSGSISYYNPNNGQSSPAIFKAQNQRDLGDVVQSMSFVDEKAYIVVNNANKIEVADANTFEELAQINNLQLPRYILAVSTSKAYVSAWGADGLTGIIYVLDLQNNSISSSISVDVGPEHMLLKDDKLYIAHVGGFADNNKVTVIDVQNDQIVQTIEVGDRPGKMVVDNNADIWLSCAGKTVYSTYPDIDTIQSTESMLVRINSSMQVDTIQQYGKANTVRYLNIDAPDNKLYFYRAAKVWSYDINNDTETELFAANLYGLSYHPTQRLLYAATSTGIDPSEALIYDLNGQQTARFEGGYFTNAFVFK